SARSTSGLNLIRPCPPSSSREPVRYALAWLAFRCIRSSASATSRGWAQRSAMPSSTQAARSASAALSELSAAPRPRLLLLITLAEVGGAQTYLIALLPALTERFEVTVAAFG